MEIREIKQEDIACDNEKALLSQVIAIEKSVFPDPWTLKSIEETFRASNYRNTVAWMDDKVVGYLFCSYVLDETEIVKIAVHPEFQKKGVATALMREYLHWCERKEINRWMLDVRSGNAPAIALYRSFGFQDDGVRKKYYTNPAEDALLMSRLI